MEIGNQIKALRQARGITQEMLAEKLNLSSQAVSKWERGVSVPDIQLLPKLSAFFGVSIDELFSLSDETRMERIQNMIWDERVLERMDLERETAFLQRKAAKEPANGRPLELLAELEGKMAKYHREKQAAYAQEALVRDPELKNAHGELTEAMGGNAYDWYYGNHHKLIVWYKAFVEKNPTVVRGYLWLLDQLLDDYRFEEAEEYLGKLSAVDRGYQTRLYAAALHWYRGERDRAHAIWQELEEIWSGEWEIFYRVAEFKGREGDYEGAKAYFRKSFSLMEKPRYIDPLDALAQLEEMSGNIPGAIAVLEEAVAISAEEWNSTAGESVDQYHREIHRLKALL